MQYLRGFTRLRRVRKAASMPRIRRMSGIPGIFGILSILLFVSGCDRDARVTRRQAPPGGAPPYSVPQIPLVPGVRTVSVDARNPFEGDEQALEEGRRLYDWMNCSGCHFAGGGGIGPPLMDEEWIYGGAPAQIFDSIASGRANGMPSYGDKLPSEQIWHITAYVQTLSDVAERQQKGAPTDPRAHER